MTESDPSGVTDAVALDGNIAIGIFDVDGDAQLATNLAACETDRERLRVCRMHTPEAVRIAQNTTVTGLHDYLALVLNPEENVSKSIDTLVVGTDATAPAVGNTALNNPLSPTTGVTDSATVDTVTTFSVFIDSTQYNGSTIAECGLKASDGTLINHALISPTVDKTNAKVLVIDIELTVAAA